VGGDPRLDRERALLASGASVHAALTDGYRLGFTVAAGAVFASVLVALALLTPRRKRAPSTVAEPDVAG
jgi:hypothetical protein